MIAAICIGLGIAAAITVVALNMPCEACRMRRERMKQAYAEWQARQKSR